MIAVGLLEIGFECKGQLRKQTVSELSKVYAILVFPAIFERSSGKTVQLTQENKNIQKESFGKGNSGFHDSEKTWNEISQNYRRQTPAPQKETKSRFSAV